MSCTSTIRLPKATKPVGVNRCSKAIGPEACALKRTIGALMIRLGFCCPLYHNYNKEQLLVIIKAPMKRLRAGRCPGLAGTL